MQFRLLRGILFLFCFVYSLWFCSKCIALLRSFLLWLLCNNYNPVTSFFFFPWKLPQSVKMGWTNLWIVGNSSAWELNKEILYCNIFTYLSLIGPLYLYQVAHIARIKKLWMSLMQIWFFSVIPFWLFSVLVWFTVRNKRRKNTVP